MGGLEGSELLVSLSVTSAFCFSSAARGDAHGCSPPGNQPGIDTQVPHPHATQPSPFRPRCIPETDLGKRVRGLSVHSSEAWKRPSCPPVGDGRARGDGAAQWNIIQLSKRINHSAAQRRRRALAAPSMPVRESRAPKDDVRHRSSSHKAKGH